MVWLASVPCARMRSTGSRRRCPCPSRPIRSHPAHEAVRRVEAAHPESPPRAGSAGEGPQIVQADLAGAQAEMKHGIGVEGRNGRDAAMRGRNRSRGQAAAEVDLGLPAAQHAVGRGRCGLPSSCRWPRPNPGEETGADWNSSWKWRRQLDGQLRGLQIAGKVRIDERAGPESIDKIHPPGESARAAPRSGLPVAAQSQVAQHGIELARLLEWNSTAKAEGLVSG
jgi:hypothetical protein